MGLKKYLLSILALLSWGTWANHCIVSDVLANSGAPKAHSHCHSEGGEEKSSSHHEKCQDKGCCQPGLHSSQSQNLAAVPLVLIAAHTPVFTIPDFRPSTQDIHSISRATGPPGKLLLLLNSLSLAPNAPPITI